MLVAAASLRPAEPGVDPALMAELHQRPAQPDAAPGAARARRPSAELVRERLGDGRRRRVRGRLRHGQRRQPADPPRAAAGARGRGRRARTARRSTSCAELGPRAASRSVLLRLARLPAGRGRGGPRRRRAGRRLGSRRRSRRWPSSTRHSASDATARPRPGGDPAPRAAAGLRASARRATRCCATSARASASSAHARAARLLAKRAAAPEQVAAHLLADAAGAARRGWSRRSAKRGARALRAGAADSAVAYLRRALEEPPVRRATCRWVLLELGLAEAFTSGPDAAEHLREAYNATTGSGRSADGSPSSLGSVLLFTGRGGRGGRDPRRGGGPAPRGRGPSWRCACRRSSSCRRASASCGADPGVPPERDYRARVEPGRRSAGTAHHGVHRRHWATTLGRCVRRAGARSAARAASLIA